MLRETTTTMHSSAATKPAGALAARSHRGPTWMTRRVGEVLCSTGDEEWCLRPKRGNFKSSCLLVK